jgi:hypothetical protein
MVLVVNLLLRVGFRVLSRPSGAAAGAPGPVFLSKVAYDRLTTSEESDADLSNALSTSMGYTVTVATYSGSFELRKVQCAFTQVDSAAPSDDLRIFTLHLIKLSGGAPSADWLAADFTNLAAAIDAWWLAVKVSYPGGTTFKSIKAYKAGPNVVAPQPPVYSADRAAIGTSGGAPMPPQVALTVTEKAGFKLNWGRFYMPAPSINNTTAYGRPTSASLTTFADATDTMYESLKTNNIPVVVYRAALPIRDKRNGVELAARAASAVTVDEIQIDDVYDVIRSRRWKYPTLRVQRLIA